MPKIMLVEDDNNLREIYGARLQAEGHDIVSAKDGEEALALAVKEKPDLIIADVMMPRISGFDMLDILRNAPETRNTKVIMMTALSQAEDKARADKLGADRYLVKSQVTLEDVVKVANELLSGEPTEASTNPTTSATPEAAQTPQETIAPAPEPAPVVTQQPTEPEPVPQPEPSVPQEEPKPSVSIPVVEAPEPAKETPTEPMQSTESTAPIAPPEEPAPAPVEAVGPNVAQALAEEEKQVNEQIDNFAKSIPVRSEAQAPDTKTEIKGIHEKKIEPIGDPLAKPDVSSLIEAEKQETSAPAPSSGDIITPTQTGGEQPSSSNDKDDTDHSAIAL